MSEQFEKAKKGLACCERRGYCEGHCPYYEPEREALECTSELAHDALALISKQKERIRELEEAHVARVMTLEEAMEAVSKKGGFVCEAGMNREVEKVLAVLDGFRMSDQMDYAAYSQLHDMISVLDVPGWISVKDRLPEQWVNVLTFQPTLRITGDRLIRVGVYIGNNKWRESERHTMMEVPVTYWMPLPEPPKEEE